MPESLSLLNKTGTFHSVKEWLGSKVPWEVKDYATDLLTAETVGGVFDLSSWAVIDLSGKDAVDYLQRMTTVNFKTLESDSATYGAFLTGKGTVVSLGVFIQQKDKVTYITSELQCRKVMEHIEKFHFAEDFQTQDVSRNFALFGWWTPRPDLLAELHLEAGIVPGKVEWRRWKSIDLEIWRDSVRSKLFFFLMQRKAAENFLFQLNQTSVSVIGHRAYEHLRIRAGVPEVGVDLTEKEIILESAFEVAVHRNKGCYPGQEVVERIFTYGSVNKKLIPVRVASKHLETLKLPFELRDKEAKIGQLVSVSTDPRDTTTGWGLAYLQKEFWDIDKKFDLDT